MLSGQAARMRATRVVPPRPSPPVGGAGPAPSTDTRSRILSAAVRLFGEQGYAGTSVRDIAESLGLTKAALYYHFPSKETILDALLDPFVTDLTQIVALTRGGSRPAAQVIVERMARLLAGPGVVLCAFVNDPSVVHRKIGEENMLSVFEEIVYCLAGPDPTPIRLIRARCAIGALQSGILGASFSRLRSAAAGEADCGGAQAPVAGWPPPPVIAEDVRCEVVEAALAALGGER